MRAEGAQSRRPEDSFSKHQNKRTEAQEIFSRTKEQNVPLDLLISCAVESALGLC
jgi:hypothetical protein